MSKGLKPRVQTRLFSMAQDTTIVEDTPLETKRLYYDDTALYECNSTIEKSLDDSVILD